MKLEGIHAHPDDVVVTTGSQQAVDLVTKIFINPGDVVIAEAPSYVGALGVFRAHEAEVVHVPMDEDGLIPESLDETITRLKAAGKRVKFLYTVPNFHNPAGVTLSLERRPRIVEIAKRHGVLILEDNPYGLLGFDSEPLPAMRSMSEDGVVYLGSFSKTFAPGFRVGWAVAPHAVREKLVLASEAARPLARVSAEAWAALLPVTSTNTCCVPSVECCSAPVNFGLLGIAPLPWVAVIGTGTAVPGSGAAAADVDAPATA